LAARNADATAHVNGMLAWAVSERVLAIWDTGWSILYEPFIPFQPRLWVGGVEYAYVPHPPSGGAPGYNSGYRHEFGSCNFYIAARFGDMGAAAPNDLIYIMPPLPPAADSVGPFGSAVVVSINSIGQVAGAGVFDGKVAPALAGATVQGHLSMSMPGTKGLLRAGDLAPDGEFDIFWSGFYPTDSFT
jgi:hypothetical protein